MKKTLTAMLSIITMSSYCQELWPAKPVDGDSKMGCTTCSILFIDPKGFYAFMQYQAPRPKPNETFIFSPGPSLKISFSAVKAQRYLIKINMDAKILKREFIVSGPGGFKYKFESEYTSDETVEFMYTAKETGSQSLSVTTRVDKEWVVKTCKISSFDIK